MLRFAVLAVAVLALTGCKPPAPTTLDPQADPIARAFFDEVRRGADIDADPHLAHELKNPTSEDQIAQFRTLIPTEPPHSVDLKDATFVTDAVGTTTKLTDVYHYSDKDLVVQTALFKSPSGVDPVIVGFQVTAAAAAN
jgi:hypothetical protein